MRLWPHSSKKLLCTSIRGSQAFIRNCTATSQSLIPGRCHSIMQIWRYMEATKSLLWFSTFNTFCQAKRGNRLSYNGHLYELDYPRQRMNKLIDVFSNLLMSKPDDVKDCLILNDLLVTLSPSTAKCECGFSSMNQLKSNLRTSMGQDTLQA